MKINTAIFCLILFAFSAFPQKPDETLATANGQNFTSKDLPSNVREAFENLPVINAETRKALLEQQIADILLEVEASARKVSVEKLIETQVAGKGSVPTKAQIQAVYDANRAAVGNKSLEEVRPQIVAFLKQDIKQKALINYIASLKTKYKVTVGKDVNSSHLKPTDILATVNGRSITAKDFAEKNKLTLYENQVDIFDNVISNLKEAIYLALVNAEARKSGISSSDLIAREITNKMSAFSMDERDALQAELRNKLFEKYNAKILLKDLEPVGQNVSIDDDPAQGKPNAPVTIVMFMDFQCPACKAVDPVLKGVTAEYGDKVRLVVRDFPLTEMHENAFNAALAANAANAQGKFFEYGEILFRNQERLDLESLKKYAGEAGLNQKQFDSDFSQEKFAAEVKKDMADAKSYGVNSTPTIFVNGVKVRTLSAEAFRNAIERALKK
ncbi:MAG: DsbA family protein [Acidobacteria bacterium]|nr:DsbA family protein [Acidobacteriota bacterium]MCA1638903.1 DsbA family protein [Acidobacteriota bacterium]